MKRVVIVGAGVIGLFCAATLSKRGLKVTLLESAEEDFSVHGPAASLAAAGMLAPVSEAFGANAAQHARLDELNLASFDLWRALHKGALWEDGVKFGGGIAIAASAEAADALGRKARAMGRTASPLSPGRFWKQTGLEARIEHALWIEDEATADPGRVLSGLTMEARRHGASILFDHDVDVIEPGLVRVFDHGTIEADAVVLAPGAWATERLAAAAPALKHVRPAKGHLVPVKLKRPLAPNIHAPGFYLAQRNATDVVLGATMEFDLYERRVDPEKVAALLAAAETLMPGEVARADQPAWAGVRAMSPDWAPMIGPSGAEGVFVACGHSRNGWLLAPITAEIVCAYVTGGEIDPLWAAFGAGRFEGSW